MLSSEDLVKEQIILDDTYQIWECQIMAPEKSTADSVIIIMGRAGPKCRGCGGEAKDFAVRFRAGELPSSSFKARDKVLLAIQDQLSE